MSRKKRTLEEEDMRKQGGREEGKEGGSGEVRGRRIGRRKEDGGGG